MIDDEIRLQKYLALCGVASRRASEEMIKQGRIKVNGHVVSEMGVKIAEGDIVLVDDNTVSLIEKKLYIMLNKPAGIITSAKDQFGRKTVVDLISGINERIFPAGRLDYETTGLVILTNDGEFMNKILHPSKKIIKTYEAMVKGIPPEDELNKLREGIMLEGKMTSPAEVRILNTENKEALIEVKISEGRNRQVRKMFDFIGFPVIHLQRTAIGNLTLNGLKVGEWRYLTEYDKNMIING